MVPEAEAVGKMKAMYQEIKQQFGIDFVPTLYRVMVINLDSLEANWNKGKAIMFVSGKRERLRAGPNDAYHQHKAEPRHGRARDNPKPWEGAKLHETGWCYPMDAYRRCASHLTKASSQGRYATHVHPPHNGRIKLDGVRVQAV
jgi:hypothetical protein